MRYMIKLYLEVPHNNVDYVKQLPALKGLDFDENYGLVIISPKRHLYTIRVSGDIEPQTLISSQPEIIGVYPADTKVSTMDSKIKTKDKEG